MLVRMKENLRNKGIKRTVSFHWPKNSEESCSALLISFPMRKTQTLDVFL